ARFRFGGKTRIAPWRKQRMRLTSRMKTILAPIDFSPISDAVVTQATALARAFDGRVILLNVIQPPLLMSEYAAAMDIAEITAAGEKHAARQLARIEEKLKADSIRTESLQMLGSPVTHIAAQ